MVDIKGFGTPGREEDLKPGDLFVGHVGDASILALQTDVVLPLESAPMVCVLKASGTFRDLSEVPFLLFRSNVMEHVRIINDAPTVRPADQDFALVGDPESSFARGYLALGVDGSAFVRAANGGGGFVWINLATGELTRSPKMPYYYRRWRITKGPDDKPVELVNFGGS